jgi:hypothetical protein
MDVEALESDKSARENLLERFRDYMSLTEAIEVECVPGEALDYSQFDQRFPITQSRLFS